MTSKVTIARMSPRRRRYKAGGGSTIDKSYIRGFADGYLVTFVEGKGWSCSCLNEECEHPEAVAEVVHPDTLARIESSEAEEDPAC